ncbi:hypothetical protein T08_5721 [Trichinella sp. T8]|nr:hypothetical protein T08_5721 [Trichinella sp. T8]
MLSDQFRLHHFIMLYHIGLKTAQFSKHQFHPSSTGSGNYGLISSLCSICKFSAQFPLILVKY